MPDHHAFAFAQTLVVEGADAGPFLQSQFTTQPLSLAHGQWQFSAWLDAQGRVRYFFQLLRLDETRWVILLRGGSAGTMKNELARFVFRSRLTMTVDDSRMLRTGDPLPLHGSEVRDECVRLGCGDHALVIDGANVADDSWRLAHIRAGWPWLPEAALGAHHPSSLGMHRLHALDLQKGCYPGQEIVARLHYRGGSKRQLCRLARSSTSADGDLSRAMDDDAHNDVQWLDIVATDDGIEALGVCRREVVAAWRAGEAAPQDRSHSLQIVEAWDA